MKEIAKITTADIDLTGGFVYKNILFKLRRFINVYINKPQRRKLRAYSELKRALIQAEFNAFFVEVIVLRSRLV